MGLETKSAIRKRLRAERQKLPAKTASKASEQITQRCLELISWSVIKSMHCYVAVSKESEVDTWRILEYAWRNYPDIQTVVPRLNYEKEYDSVVVTPKTKWRYEGVRIPEPIDEESLDNSIRFDVIIVPMLGFDNTGHRLGHGLGWYDRFLKTQPNALTIGLSYEFGLVETGLPVEPHDVALNYIVTEKTVRKF